MNALTFLKDSMTLLLCIAVALARMFLKVTRFSDQTTASSSAMTVAARGELYISASSPKDEPGWAAPTCCPSME
jgi:hypothetical protein